MAILYCFYLHFSEITGSWWIEDDHRWQPVSPWREWSDHLFEQACYEASDRPFYGVTL